MTDDDFFDALPSGYELQEYRIDSVLGQGGFGITYKALDQHLNKYVAIKEYLPDTFAKRNGKDEVRPKGKSSEPDFEWGLDRFEKEAKTLGQFEHPNIVPVLRLLRANGTAYMVMAYQEGESLGHILDHAERLEESELEEILYPLMDGLEAVHEAGTLHRDIKPDNIFIRLQDGTPVLLDFGAARQAIGERDMKVTRIVTPNYAPYEQYYSDGNLGPWTDIYALACVIYEGIVGRPPPEAPGRATTDTYESAVKAGKGAYRKKFLEAIDWALAVLPEDRPQSVADWREKNAGAARPRPCRGHRAQLAAIDPAALRRKEEHTGRRQRRRDRCNAARSPAPRSNWPTVPPRPVRPRMPMRS